MTLIIGFANGGFGRCELCRRNEEPKGLRLSSRHYLFHLNLSCYLKNFPNQWVPFDFRAQDHRHHCLCLLDQSFPLVEWMYHLSCRSIMNEWILMKMLFIYRTYWRWCFLYILIIYYYVFTILLISTRNGKVHHSKWWNSPYKWKVPVQLGDVRDNTYPQKGTIEFIIWMYPILIENDPSQMKVKV